MLETIESTETGTGNLPKRGPGRPPNQPAIHIPVSDTPDWVTPEEAEKYESMMFKPYKRKVELKKGDGDKYFYQIVSMCPYVPSGIVSQTHQHLVTFEIQKFHRKDFIERNVFDDNRKQPRVVKENAEVQWVSVNPKDGNARVLDEDASFQIDSREFEKVFVRDDK